MRRRSRGRVRHRRRLRRWFLHHRLIRNENVADTLARQGEGFAVGVADQRVFVIFCQIRNFHVSVDKLAVRFINDQINRMAVFGRFCFQKSSELLNAFFCVDNAGRIVRRIDETPLVCAVTAAERRSSDLERGRISRRFDHGCACRFDENTVFRKVRGKYDILVARNG